MKIGPREELTFLFWTFPQVVSFSAMQPPKYRCKMPACDGDDFQFDDFLEVREWGQNENDKN